MGEQRAALVPGLPGHSLQLPRARRYRAAGLGGARAAGRGAGSLWLRRGRRGRDAEWPPRPGTGSPPGPPSRASRAGAHPLARHSPLGSRAHAVPLSPREHARAGLGTRGDGVRLCHFPGGPSNVQFSGGHPGDEAFQPPGLPLNRRSRSAPDQACSCAGPGREARVIVSPAFLLLDEVVFRVSGSGRTVSSCSDQREELCSPPVGSGMCDLAAYGLPATWGPSPGLCGPWQRHGRALWCPGPRESLLGRAGPVLAAPLLFVVS